MGSFRRWSSLWGGLVLIYACRPADTSEENLRTLSFVLDEWKVVTSILGFAGTVSALVFGFRQYRRADEWKRAEFLAKETKEFFSDPKVSMALMLSDWGGRHVHLFALVAPGDATVTHVTRGLQISALLPHPIVDPIIGSDFEGPGREGEAPRLRRFTREQAIIRDCFDAYLDGLERFGSFLSTGLVTAENLRPYLGYWIKDLATPTTDADDAAWAACVITYIHFYGYDGVRLLFEKFGYDIGPTGRIYTDFTAHMKDGVLAQKLRASIGRT